jgi:hypothetical protein
MLQRLAHKMHAPTSMRTTPPVQTTQMYVSRCMAAELSVMLAKVTTLLHQHDRPTAWYSPHIHESAAVPGSQVNTLPHMRRLHHMHGAGRTSRHNPFTCSSVCDPPCHGYGPYPQLIATFASSVPRPVRHGRVHFVNLHSTGNNRRHHVRTITKQI